MQDFSGRLSMVSDRLSRGDDFADVAAELSTIWDQQGLGGELGFTDGTAFPEEMEAAIGLAGRLRVRCPSPVETDAGTHLIRLEERIAGNAVDYESVKAELRASIEDDGGRTRVVDRRRGAEGFGIQCERSGWPCGGY
jgi:peptidyl-prolyl cis-trans isomerase D